MSANIILAISEVLLFTWIVFKEVYNCARWFDLWFGNCQPVADRTKGEDFT